MKASRNTNHIAASPSFFTDLGSNYLLNKQFRSFRAKAQSSYTMNLKMQTITQDIQFFLP
jgi:hypothetical protein